MIRYTYIIKYFLLAIFCSLSIVSHLHAEKHLDEYEDLTIRKIYVDIKNLKNVDETYILAHIKLREGMQYDPVKSDQSIRALYKSGLFDYVKVGLREAKDSGIDIVFTVYPRYRISEVVFQGNKKAATRKLLKQISLDAGMVIDESKLKSEADKIKKYYQKRGYYEVKVDPIVDRDKEHGTGKVTFLIDEGVKRRISKITFLGNEHVKTSKLKRLIKTATWHPFSWLTGSGYIKEKIFREDIDKIKKYYKNNGYLDVQINDADIVFDHTGSSSVAITIYIHEGKQYKAGAVTISGNTLYSTEELAIQVDMKPGDVLAADVLDKDAERLKNFYGMKGYLDTYIVIDRKANLETDTIDVTYVIRESDKFRLESIIIQGNTKTKSTVIIRELALAPGDIFDLVRMKNSEARLKNTGFFKEVNLSAESTHIPNRKNLKISLTEAKTGSLTFGGGISSIEAFLVFAEISQTNFDLFSYKTGFRGGGQKFRIRFALGERSHEILLGFEEPWLFQREVAVGFELFHVETGYLSSLYNEVRTGIEIYMRKWFFEAIEGRLSYRLEEVRLFNIDGRAPAAIKREEGSRTVSKIGLSLLYDTRDNLIYPTEGTRLQLLADIAGGPAGGPTKYYRLEGRAGQWIRVAEAQEQVLGIFGRAGGINNYGGSDLPFFERYFLGGPNNLRGYDFRKAGPFFSDGEPKGGKLFGFASTEYSLVLFNPVRFVLFYDIGFLNESARDFSLGDYLHDLGFGFRIFILGAPLKLDFGYPLRTNENTGKGIKIHWTFGTSF